MVAEGEGLKLESERNLVANMPSVLCWNVASVEGTFQEDDGTALQNIKKQSGNAFDPRNQEKDFARIQREYRNR